jgi:hypothetical protein
VAVIAWLGVVFAGSTMTWATINTAGQEVLSPGSVPTPRTAGVPPPVRDPVTLRPTPDGSKQPEPGPRRTPSPPSPSPEEGASRSPDGEPARSPAPNRTAAPPPAPAPPAPAAPAPRAFTWRGTAGSVTVVCDGSAIALQAASPANGYTVDVREGGPDEVDVRLETDDDEAEVEEADVEAECESGQAVFDISD